MLEGVNVNMEYLCGVGWLALRRDPRDIAVDNEDHIRLFDLGFDSESKAQPSWVRGREAHVATTGVQDPEALYGVGKVDKSTGNLVVASRVTSDK